MYRIGLPFWRYAARRGALLRLRVDVQRDAQAGVFVATRGDLRGLVCEAASMDELWREISLTVDALLDYHLGTFGRRPAIDLRLLGATPSK
jgi:hypothetical protein